MSIPTVNAAELRRQKILARGQERLNLLIGVKNAEEQIKEGKTVPDLSPGEPDSLASLIRSASASSSTSMSPASSPSEGDKVFKPPSPVAPAMLETSGLRDRSTKVPKTPIQFTPKSSKFEPPSPRCKFNGYSNKEILIITTLALVTSLLFNLEYSRYIYHNALVPFMTFQIAHLVIHFNQLPTTSSQYQIFSTMLCLCGISQKSLKNLMTVFNFLFILIDNFVIYLFSLVVFSLVFSIWDVKSLVYA